MNVMIIETVGVSRSAQTLRAHLNARVKLATDCLLMEDAALVSDFYFSFNV